MNPEDPLIAQYVALKSRYVHLWVSECGVKSLDSDTDGNHSQPGVEAFRCLLAVSEASPTFTL